MPHGAAAAKQGGNAMARAAAAHALEFHVAANIAATIVAAATPSSGKTRRNLLPLFNLNSIRDASEL